MKYNIQLFWFTKSKASNVPPDVSNKPAPIVGILPSADAILVSNCIYSKSWVVLLIIVLSDSSCKLKQFSAISGNKDMFMKIL